MRYNDKRELLYAWESLPLKTAGTTIGKRRVLAPCGKSLIRGSSWDFSPL